MIENESQYKKKLSEILENLQKIKLTDLHVRFIFRRVIGNEENERKDVEFYNEDIGIKDGVRNKMLGKLIKDFKNKNDEEISIHTDYKLNFKIEEGQVGILNEENYPEELECLISSMNIPSPDPKPRTKKEIDSEKKIPIAFAVGFHGVIYVKRVRKIKLMSSGKKIKNSYLYGTKFHKITTVNQDFLLLTFTEPDIIVCTSDDGNGSAFIYNFYNFNLICATTNHMLEMIKKDRGLIENVIDNADKLIVYLKNSWMCVSPTYFMINRKDFKPFEQNYINKLNSKGIFKATLQIDKESKKLVTEELTGKEIYNIILGKYGSEYTLDGTEKPIIIESFSEAT
jgi:hypothetical protein